MSNKDEGRRLALALSTGDPAASAEARAALSRAPPSITDPAAKQLIALLAKGGTPAESICQALAEPDAPRFGGASFSRLLLALTEAQSKGGTLQGLATQASTNMFGRGPDDDYIRKLEDDRPPASARLPLRILSVGRRIWVWVVFGMASLFAIPAMVSGSGTAILGVAGLTLLAVVVVIIDAFKRRCPSCHTLLAGQLLSIVQDGSYTSTVAVQTTRGTEMVDQTVNTHRRTWRCVECGHRWST